MRQQSGFHMIEEKLRESTEAMTRDLNRIRYLDGIGSLGGSTFPPKRAFGSRKANVIFYLRTLWNALLGRIDSYNQDDY